MCANQLMLTWLIISYYYPENQNKGASRHHARRGFLTLSDMFTVQTRAAETEAYQRPALIAALSNTCALQRASDVLSYRSQHEQVQGKLSANMYLMQSLLLFYLSFRLSCSALRSGLCCFEWPTLVRTLFLQSLGHIKAGVGG